MHRSLAALLTGCAFAVSAEVAVAQRPPCPTPPDLSFGGAGTPGTNGLAVLSGPRPFLLFPWHLTITNGFPDSPGALLMSFEKRPVPLGFFNATLYPFAPAFFAFRFDSNGDSGELVPVRKIPRSACGFTLYWQAVFIDPGATGTVAFTDAIDVTFGTIPTTVTGVVRLPNGDPAGGATVTVVGQDTKTGTTAADGTFSILDVAPDLGDIVVDAEIGSDCLTGESHPAVPVPEGTTDVGTIDLASSAATVAIGHGGGLLQCSGTGNVMVVHSCSLAVLSTYTQADAIRDVELSADGTVAVVTSECTTDLRFLDVTVDPATVMATLTAPFQSGLIEVTATNYAIISQVGARRIASYDIATQTLVNAINGSVGTRAIRAAPDGSFALLGEEGSSVVHKLDISPTGTISWPGQSLALGGVSSPVRIAFSDAQGFLQAVVARADTVLSFLRFPAGVPTLQQHFLPGVPPFHITTGAVYHPDGSELWLETKGLVAGRSLLRITLDASGNPTASPPALDPVFKGAGAGAAIQQLDLDVNGNLFVTADGGPVVFDTNNPAAPARRITAAGKANGISMH